MLESGADSAWESGFDRLGAAGPGVKLTEGEMMRRGG